MDASSSIGVSASGDVYLLGYALSNPSGGAMYCIKYNSAGVIQWQRVWTTNNASYGDQFQPDFGSVTVATDGSLLYGAYGVGAGSAVGFPMVFKMPANGTGTGSYTLQSCIYTYASASGTDSDYTSSITSAAGSHGSTSVTATATDGTSSFTSTTVSKDTVSVV